MTLKQVVEALVFASPKPLSTKEIIAALKSAGNPEKTQDERALAYAKTKEDEVLATLSEIQVELETSGRAFRLMEQVNGWSFVTDPNAVHWVRQLYPEAKPTRLSGPQLETLAIIAYRQPVTRADIEAVRGVAVDGVVQVLMERSLIKIAGRADVPGRPLLYETTQYFLQHFGLKTVTDLPNASELRRVELPKAEYPEEKPDDGAAKEPKEPKVGKGKKGKAAAATAEGASPAEVTADAAPVPEGAATDADVGPEVAEQAEPVEVAESETPAMATSPEDSGVAEEAPAPAPNREPEVVAPEPEPENDPIPTEPEPETAAAEERTTPPEA